MPVLPLLLWACDSHPLEEPHPRPQQETDFSVLVSPEREVDLLFLVDNSPSMDPKQGALAHNFTKMIQQLELLPGGLPDVHIGVVDSDMGAGSGELGNNCSRVLGDRGILWGNDPTPGALATVAGGATHGCGLNPGARWIEDIQSPDGTTRIRNYTGDIADVFKCLATAVGTGGCGEEHQLQAIRLALNPQVGDPKHPDQNPPINPENVGFLRDKAYLAIVLITDEDDCSAVPDSNVNDPVNNGGIFLQRSIGDTTSLRCAAAGHVCNGVAIPNYSLQTGYDGSNGPFSTDFANCVAKEPKSPPDYQWLPLIPIEDMVASVKQVKQRPSEQVLVSAIIGWPPDNKLEGLQYRIDKDPTSPDGDAQRWDYYPICEIPAIKSADGNTYKAYGGLREKKFVDAFGTNGQTFSICNSDFTNAMTQIGKAIVQKLKPGCVQYPLIDTDPAIPDIQPECQVLDKISCDTPGRGQCLASGYQESPLMECRDPSTGLPLAPKNPNLDGVPESGRPCWYLSYDKDPVTGCPGTFNGQMISALRKRGQTAPAGTLLSMQCLTCPNADGQCQGPGL